MATVRIDDVELFFERTGEGTPIVFLHEFAGDYRSWEIQVRCFARRYSVVTFNARGYPPSEVPEDSDAYSQDIAVEDLRGLLDHLEDHDLGGLIGKRRQPDSRAIDRKRR